MANSTRSAAVKKWRAWKRLHPDFPLVVSPNGYWSKTVRGKTHYFGPLQDKDVALQLWLRKAPYLRAGMTVPTPGGKFSVAELAVKFAADTAARLARGEICQTNAKDLRHAAAFVAEHLDAGLAVELLTPEHFAKLRAAIAETGRNLRSQKNLITQIRGMFTWGASGERGMGFYPAVRFGPRFRPPSTDALRKERESTGRDRFIEQTTIRGLLDTAEPALRCMILLGINCGFYAIDSIRIPFSRIHLDHDPPYHDFPRTKNGRPRKAVLWPETVEALRDYIADHRGSDPSQYVILNRYGRPYADASPGRGIRSAFARIVRDSGVSISPGASIGSLRHTYGTVVDLSADQQMIDLSMGHAAKGIQKRIYSQRNLGELDRLAELAGVVRGWLYEDDGEPAAVPFRVVG